MYIWLLDCGDYFYKQTISLIAQYSYQMFIKFFYLFRNRNSTTY